MPLVRVSMYGGRKQREKKDRLAVAMTEDRSNNNIKKKEEIIVFHEAHHVNWYSSRVSLSYNYNYIFYVDANCSQPI